MIKQKIIWIFFAACLATYSYAEERPILEADEVRLDEADGVVVAIGNIDLRYGGDQLFADKLTWRQRDNIVIAEGAVRLIRADGTKTAAARAELSEDLSEGAIEALRITLPQGAWIKAARATRNKEQMQLNKAQYSACPQCETEPNKPLLWRVKSAQTIYDKSKQDIIYRHARLEIFGVPVFYAPYFTHPAPEVKRRSGFLAPTYSSSGQFGFSLTTPYFFDLAPNYDLTLSPRFTAKQNIVLGGTWRHLTKAGRYELAAYGHKPSGKLARIDGEHDYRGGIIGGGDFTSAQGWKTNFKIEESSDDAFFRRYDINNKTVLESRLALAKFSDAHDFAITTHRYQRTLDDETADTVDYIAPRFNYRYHAPQNILGGRVAISNHFTHSIRDKGVDISTFGAQLDYHARKNLFGGLVLDFENRFDADRQHYHTEAGDPEPTPPLNSNRNFAAAATAAKLSLPLVRFGAATTSTLTPSVQIIGATENDRYAAAPHRDTNPLELDSASLFQIQNPEDEASRINYGIDYQLTADNGFAAAFLIGQSYNISAQEQNFTPASGLRDDASAIIAETKIAYGAFSFNQNMRLAPDADKILRAHANLNLNFTRLQLATNYNFFAENEIETSSGSNSVREEIYAEAGWRLNKHWRISGSVREDLDRGTQRFGSLGLHYSDDCTLFNISVSRNNTSATTIEPETRINFNIVLKSLSN